MENKLPFKCANCGAGSASVLLPCFYCGGCGFLSSDIQSINDLFKIPKRRLFQKSEFWDKVREGARSGYQIFQLGSTVFIIPETDINHEFKKQLVRLAVEKNLNCSPKCELITKIKT